MYAFDSIETEVLINPHADHQSNQEALSKLPKTGEYSAHFWIATSGTTAKSSTEKKWVALSKNAVITSAQAVNTHFSSNSDDVWLHVLPNYHVGGLGIWARAHLSGAKVADMKIASPKWTAKGFSDFCMDINPTLTALVPAQVYDLVTENIKPVPSLRAVIVGGGALSQKLYEKASELGWPLCQSYGLSECASQVATAHVGDPFGKMCLLSHIALRTDGDSLIHLKSGSLLTSYAFLNENEFRLQDPKVDGWLKTEDMGSFANNSLTIYGRSGGFIKIGGESVNFTQLEMCFQEVCLDFNVKEDCAILSVPDERLGRVIHMMATVSHSMEQVIERFNQRVMPYEKIRHMRVVEAIPRTSLGKMKK